VKIAVASSGLGHVARGIEAWAADLGRALYRRGIEVTLYKGGGQSAQPYERVIPCWRRGTPKTRWVARHLTKRFFWRLGLGSELQIEQATFALRLLVHLRRQRIDILHTQEPQSACIVQRARRLGLVATRTILANGTLEPPDYLARLDYVQHLSPWHLDDVRRAGVWKPTWTAIPNFINTDLFRPQPDTRLRDELGIPRDAAVILCAAAIKADHKRVDYLLREFAAFRTAHPASPTWLVVAGARELDTDRLLSMGHNLLGDRVRFLVSWPRERMPELYRAADLFVLCSLREMFGIVLIEATASGLPCLVHRNPVIEWVVGPGGIAIDMTGAGALAGALTRCLGQSGACRAMGPRAREYCVANFGEDTVVDQMLEYYQAVLRDGEKAVAARSASTGREFEVDGAPLMTPAAVGRGGN
jgi:glycosyltransferase involved in cell wall biosynthesis